MDFAGSMARQWEEDSNRQIDEMSGDGDRPYKEREYSNEELEEIEDDRMRDWE